MALLKICLAFLSGLVNFGSATGIQGTFTFVDRASRTWEVRMACSTWDCRQSSVHQDSAVRALRNGEDGRANTGCSVS